jgi:methyl-accepting chemotaxis protein
VSKALQQLDQVIQSNAAAAEELASTSEQLSGQAEQLQSAVGFFKLDQVRLQAAPVRKVKAPGAALRKAAPKPPALSPKKKQGVTLVMEDEQSGDDDQFERF